MFAGEFAEEIRGQERAVAEWFIEPGDERREKRAAFIEVERFVVVEAAERVGDELCVAGFVERRVGEPDAERVQFPLRDVPRCEGCDGAGIDAAAEKYAERNVGHEAAFGRGFERVGELLGDGVLRSERDVGLDLEAPPLPRFEGVRREVVGECVAAGELPHTLDDAARSRDVAPREVFLQRDVGDGARASRVLQQRGQLAGKAKRRAFVEVIERLFPKAVARAEEPAPHGIVDDEGPHAVQLFRERVAPFRVGVEERLRVAVVGVEAVAERSQLRAEFGVVVDFAVEDDAELAALRATACPHRLRASAQVHDTQPPEAEEDARTFLVPMPRIIRPAMGDARGHPLKCLAVPEPRKPCYSAHVGCE